MRDLRPTIRRWTRADTVVRRWVTAIDVKAVLLSWDVRERWADELGRSFGFPDAKLRELLDQASDDHLKEITILLSAYCGREEWNDLGQEDSNWRLLLELQPGGDMLREVSIEAVNLPEAFVARFLAELAAPWRKLYWARFRLRHRPVAEVLSTTERLRLHVVGPLGEAIVSWRLDDAERRQISGQ